MGHLNLPVTKSELDLMTLAYITTVSIGLKPDEHQQFTWFNLIPSLQN